MPFQFTCPYCFNKTLVEESYAGQKGPCASCGKTVTIVAPTGRSPSGRAGVAPSNSSTSVGSTISSRPSEGSPVGLLRHPLVRKLLLALAGAVGLLLVGWFAWGAIGSLGGLTIVQNLRERSAKAQCMNNLSRIARALNQYAATHGTYPPPITYDQDGKPMHSWRVLILPDLGEHHVYNEYRFDEPWDSPNNSNLVGIKCPRVFISPARADYQYASETSYFLVVGDGTVFPSKGPPLTPNEIGDGLDNTLLVVEAQNTSHVWTEPIDIDFRNLKGTANSVGIGGTHKEGFTGAFADGLAGWFPDSIPSDQLRNMISANGSEVVDRSVFTKQ